MAASELAAARHADLLIRPAEPAPSSNGLEPLLPARTLPSVAV
jgi:hypothetical protein